MVDHALGEVVPAVVDAGLLLLLVGALLLLVVLSRKVVCEVTHGVVGIAAPEVERDGGPPA